MVKNTMEEKKPSRVKSVAKFFFNVPAWIGVDNLKENTNWLMFLIKRTFNFKKPGAQTKVQSFSEVAERFHVSPEALAETAKTYLLFSFIFLLLAVLAVFYTAYLFSHGSLLVALGGFVVFALFLVRAYFYSLWYAQIKQQRLGCSFKEWLIWLFRGQV